MTKLILADTQPIYRAGIARVLSAESDFRIVAQCSDLERTLHAISTFPDSTILMAAALHPEWARVMALLKAMASRGIVILENADLAEPFMNLGLHGAFYRGSTGGVLMECLRTVVRGGLSRPVIPELAQLATEDSVGARVRDRLTPKEMRIVALIVQGCKNREIAFRLKTTEQVVKNYLRSIYDKTGVSDRLELALFTLHHRVLAEAASEMGQTMEREGHPTTEDSTSDLLAERAMPQTGT